jgi:hypothetical protein
MKLIPNEPNDERVKIEKESVKKMIQNMSQPG